MPGEALSLSIGICLPVTRAVEVLAIDSAGKRSLPAWGSHGVGVAPVIGIPASVAVGGSVVFGGGGGSVFVGGGGSVFVGGGGSVFVGGGG